MCVSFFVCIHAYVRVGGSSIYRNREKQLLTMGGAPVASISLPTPLPLVSSITEWTVQCVIVTIIIAVGLATSFLEVLFAAVDGHISSHLLGRF